MDKNHFDEIPTISSTLRWEEVSLPEAISEADLDQIILSVMTSRSQKTAMVVGKAMERCRQLDLPINAESLGARIGALAEADRIEGAGDLRYWRHSEVWLKNLRPGLVRPHSRLIANRPPTINI